MKTSVKSSYIYISSILKLIVRSGSFVSKFPALSAKWFYKTSVVSGDWKLTNFFLINGVNGVVWDLCWIDFHDILRLFDVLPNFLFTASEAMHDY